MWTDVHAVLRLTCLCTGCYNTYPQSSEKPSTPQGGPSRVLDHCCGQLSNTDSLLTKVCQSNMAGQTSATKAGTGVWPFSADPHRPCPLMCLRVCLHRMTCASRIPAGVRVGPRAHYAAYPTIIYSGSASVALRTCTIDLANTQRCTRVLTRCERCLHIALAVSMCWAQCLCTACTLSCMLCAHGMTVPRPEVNPIRTGSHACFL